MPDHRLPTTQEELRDWLAAAWLDGWNARKRLIGKPAGTIIHSKPTLLDGFLHSWDLPPMPRPAVVPIREAIMKLGELDKGEDG